MNNPEKETVSYDPFYYPPKPNKLSILLEAHNITNNERNEQYGNHKEAFTLYSEIADKVFGIEISPQAIVKVMMSIKLGRQKYKHKEDNLRDLAGYSAILNELNNI